MCQARAGESPKTFDTALKMNSTTYLRSLIDDEAAAKLHCGFSGLKKEKNSKAGCLVRRYGCWR